MQPKEKFIKHCHHNLYKDMNKTTKIIEKGDWKNELGKVKFCEQRQDSLEDQLKDLVKIANRFGFYDAADHICSICHSKEKVVA
jgi:hypothetical protein